MPQRDTIRIQLRHHDYPITCKKLSMLRGQVIHKMSHCQSAGNLRRMCTSKKHQHFLGSDACIQPYNLASTFGAANDFGLKRASAFELLIPFFIPGVVENLLTRNPHRSAKDIEIEYNALTVIELLHPFGA